LEWFEVTQSCGEYWLKAMDWSHLRTLDFREGSFSTPLFSLLLPIADNLPALESIGLNLPFWTENDVREQRDDLNSPLSLTRQLFSTARPQSLLDVRIQGPYRPLLPDILNHHATSLKRLSLHETETSSEDNQRIPLSLEELEEIGTKSTGLEALALDVNISKGHAWVSVHPGFRHASLTLHPLAGRHPQRSSVSDVPPIEETNGILPHWNCRRNDTTTEWRTWVCASHDRRGRHEPTFIAFHDVLGRD